MKLSEIKLFEEPIPTVAAEEVWSSGSAEAAQYITTTVYYVRELDTDQFEVLYDKMGNRKAYGKMDKEDLEAAFAPMRPNQKPDAEGFLTYRSADVFDAFKYGGDPVKVSIDKAPEGEVGGQTVKLNLGDWMLRQDDGNDFIYTAERAVYFDNNYTKK